MWLNDKEKSVSNVQYWPTLLFFLAVVLLASASLVQVSSALACDSSDPSCGPGGDVPPSSKDSVHGDAVYAVTIENPIPYVPERLRTEPCMHVQEATDSSGQTVDFFQGEWFLRIALLGAGVVLGVYLRRDRR